MANVCEQCGFDWNTSMLEELRAIGELPERTRTVAIGSGDRVYERPSPDVWSPNEYIWHLSDAFNMFAEWMHTIRTQDNGVLVPIDPDRVAEARRFGEKNVDVAIWMLDYMSRLFIQEAAMTDPRRTGMYKDWREVTAAEVVGFAAHEAVHHLHDLEAALPLTA